MPLFEPTIPAERIPKPKKQRKKRKRRKINTGRIWALTFGAIALIMGLALIYAHYVRVKAGNPPQGYWDGVGILLIGVLFYFVWMDSSEGQNRWTRRR